MRASNAWLILGGNSGVWGGVRIEGRLDVRGVATALRRGPLVAVRGGHVVFMQVPIGLYADTKWSLRIRHVVFVQEPRGLYAGSAWYFLRYQVIFAQGFLCGRCTGVAWSF